MKRIKRFIFFILIISCLLTAGAVFISVRYQKEIIQLFIGEVNKQLSAPVNVEHVDFSLLKNFPQVTITLENATMEDPQSRLKIKMARINSMQFSFNLFHLLQNKIIIKGIKIEDAEIWLLINQDGVPNYNILKKREGSDTTLFNLQNIELERTSVHYNNQKNNLSFDVFTPKTKASISGRQKNTSIKLKGDLLIKGITSHDKTYFEQKKIKIDTDLGYITATGMVNIEHGDLVIDQGLFRMKGSIDTKEKLLDLSFEGEKTNFRTLLSLLPNELSKKYRAYRSKGDVFFDSQVSGSYRQSRGIDVKVDFGSRSAYFYHPKFKKGIEDVSFEGTFHNGAANAYNTFKLAISNFSCDLDNKRIQGNLTFTNFDDPQVDFSIKGIVDVNSLMDIFPNDLVKHANGRMDLDVSCVGKISDLKSRQRRERFKANGEVNLYNVSFILYGEMLPFNRFNGSFMFNKNDLAISNFSGEVGKSNFILNGYFKSIIAYFFSKKQGITIEADLQSSYMDFDELLQSNFASKEISDENESKYNFSISPNLNLRFNCIADHVKFKRFHGRNIRGKVTVNDRIAVFKELHLQSMGGKIALSGSVSSKQRNIVELITDAELDKLHIDSVFFVFGNFNQNWLADRNLKGQIYADVNTYMRFDDHLKLSRPSLKADIQVRIENGELIDFEPMQKLSKYVEEEDLAHLTFSRMQNSIKISDQVIKLPEMQIRSNVSTLSINGTHTFDQAIDYHITLPVKSFINLRKRRDFEEQTVDGSNLLLKITGTTRDYEISYDKTALGNRISKDFSDEKSEWKQIIKGDTNRLKETTPELEEEEYFEFENDPDNK